MFGDTTDGSTADSGYDDFYDERGAMGALDDPFFMSGLSYSPNLQDVGHGSAYWPGDVSEDAGALTYLGILTTAVQPSTGTQQGDMAAQAGAWDPAFRAAVTAFQTGAAIPADGWIGPGTRSKLAIAVAARNAQDSPIAPPFVPPPTPQIPGGFLPPPAVIPPVAPQLPPIPNPSGPGAPPANHAGPDYTTWALYGAGAIAVLGLGYYALK